MSELMCLELSVVLWIAHVLCQAGAAQPAGIPPPWLFSPRDKPVAPQGLFYGRATRALANYVENFTAFAALDLAFIATHQPGGWGPTIWIIARILYLPLYLFGVLYVRTIAWTISVIALLMMLARLAWG
jgi:uncharacterized MAPEG superfamily protein